MFLSISDRNFSSFCSSGMPLATSPIGMSACDNFLWGSFRAASPDGMVVCVEICLHVVPPVLLAVLGHYLAKVQASRIGIEGTLLS